MTKKTITIQCEECGAQRTINYRQRTTRCLACKKKRDRELDKRRYANRVQYSHTGTMLNAKTVTKLVTILEDNADNGFRKGATFYGSEFSMMLKLGYMSENAIVEFANKKWRVKGVPLTRQRMVKL